MAGGGGEWQRSLSFGGRLPWGVGLILIVTVALSLLAGTVPDARAGTATRS